MQSWIDTTRQEVTRKRRKKIKIKREKLFRNNLDQRKAFYQQKIPKTASLTTFYREGYADKNIKKQLIVNKTQWRI